MRVESAEIYALDFSSWKRASVRQSFPTSRVHFVSRADKVPADAWLAVWGMRELPFGLAAGVRVVRLEDGFLRSVGLGADLIRPMSWVVDKRGLYYDARSVSDIEVLLNEAVFSAAMIARARALRERVVNSCVTKYNVGHREWQAPGGDKRLILVLGQVESDAALAFGAPGIRRNMNLLRAVREANAHAYVVYKPHPDVVARLRAAGEDEHLALQWCDEMVTDASIDQLLAAANEVHVMTSLAGFEALLRGKAVTCYGHPFYAGWGLTTDVVPMSRRRRVLSLDELVFAALIAYPVYFDRQGQGQITPEVALDQLLAWRTANGTKTPWWRALKRVILRQVVRVK
ncbi:capsular polysaccharide export protein, LipB/KpsS family [Rhodoferax antarcticus]|uniref:capsular polysaccharide export protein, LipB/KpsS family n=1 Tax=Rhodoferax antarcticus TaxID=81479 RepID=UPI0029FF4E59|nr:beta-3-deoxy-D-manno-oct-2-ulosonic acid transferase [Rhodoferax antarcticus]